MSRDNEEIDKINKIIGDKIFHLRLGRGKAREEISEMIGVSHQQLQKYENAKNRVSFGRLVLIARALNVSVNYFYDDCDLKNSEDPRITQHQRLCIEVSRNFMNIKSGKQQEAVSGLVKSLAQKEVKDE